MRSYVPGLVVPEETLTGDLPLEVGLVKKNYGSEAA